MKIYVTNVFVDDQDKAEQFYTDVLGFKVKNNIPLGENRWLTVVSGEDPEGTELLLTQRSSSGPPSCCSMLTEYM